MNAYVFTDVGNIHLRETSDRDLRLSLAQDQVQT